MVSTVGLRPNHYETLGLPPTASSEEIAQAFAREISRPRAFGGVAQIGIAYETLRDPARRRAYDASIGLTPEPVNRPITSAAPFVGKAQLTAVARPASDTLSRPATPPIHPQARREPIAERRLGSFIADSLRERPEAGAHASPAPEAKREPARMPEAAAEPAPAPQVEATLSVPPAEETALVADERPIAWKRPAIAAGAVVLAAGIVGAFAGSWSGGGIDDAEPARAAVTVPLPAAKAPAPDIVEPSRTPARSLAEARPQSSLPAVVAAAPIASKAPPQPVVAAEQMPEDDLALQGQPEAVATKQAAAEAPAAPAVPASLPLPNATIARTIERIGYACGQVASTAPAEGGTSGVFKVTCSSGHTYQARPVRGRYHFRRWGRN